MTAALMMMLATVPMFSGPKAMQGNQHALKAGAVNELNTVDG